MNKKQILQLRKPPLAALILICTFTVLSSKAQDAPKIGLVLSGGGAKGMAHIGILKALEKAGITPDFITGTSMGSIMGGLYASGYSADEIKQIALSADWDQLLTNKIKLNEVSYDEKDYYGRYIYEVSMNGLKPELPKGLIEGQKLSTLLTNLTRPVMNITDFSKIPIPFACIAADIENGNRVVLNKGSLARSMRASMAIPSVFTPVTIDNRLLVDGGLVHNFPVEESIDMGADYIIGVFVGTNLLTKDEIGSPVSVLTQSAFIMGSYDTEKQKKLVDLYIEPDMTLFGSGDFHKAAGIIAMGEKYGDMFLEKFKQINDSLKALGRVNRKISRPAVSDSVAFSAVSIKNNSLVPDDFIMGRLGLKNENIISVSNLESNITGLYGTGFFTKILYDVQETEKGNEIIIDVTEAPQGKIRTALQYDTETRMSLLLNLTYRNLLLNDSRLVMEGEISENPLADLNYMKYFGTTHNYGLAGGYYFRNIEVPDFEDEQIEGIYDYNFSRYYVSLHSSHRANRILKLTYSYETAALIPQVGIDDIFEIEKLNYRRHNIEARFGYNNLDERYFPSKGNELDISLKYAARGSMSEVIMLPDSVNPTRIDLDTEEALLAGISHRIVVPLGSRLSVGMVNAFWLNPLAGDESANTTSGFITRNFIGGFRTLAPNARSFMGAEPLRYYADNLYYNELKIQYEVRRKLYLQINTQYYNARYPLGFIFPYFEDQDYYFGGKDFLFCTGATAGYLSPIGPISMSVAKGNTGAGWQYFLNIGFFFDRK